MTYLEATRSIKWKCSQGDNCEVVGGCLNFFGEPLEMCAYHLENALNNGVNAGVVFDYEELCVAYVSTYYGPSMLHKDISERVT